VSINFAAVQLLNVAMSIVALGPDTHQKVVMEGVMEVGRYFILYEV
jgi:hypothetical protein